MIDKRTKKHTIELLTRTVTRQLHFFDEADKRGGMSWDPGEVQEAMDVAVDRYRNDYIFHAKVQSMVAELMRTLYA